MFIIASAGLGTLAYLAQHDYSDKLSEYNASRDAYLNADPSVEPTELARDMVSKYSSANDACTMRNVVVSLAIGLYGINLLDAARTKGIEIRLAARDSGGSRSLAFCRPSSGVRFVVHRGF
jgi:hypothetical protein